MTLVVFKVFNFLKVVTLVGGATFFHLRFATFVGATGTWNEIHPPHTRCLNCEPLAVNIGNDLANTAQNCTQRDK